MQVLIPYRAYVLVEQPHKTGVSRPRRLAELVQAISMNLSNTVVRARLANKEILDGKECIIAKPTVLPVWMWLLYRRVRWW